jgi:hypothetical protein
MIIVNNESLKAVERSGLSLLKVIPQNFRGRSAENPKHLNPDSLVLDKRFELKTIRIRRGVLATRHYFKITIMEKIK